MEPARLARYRQLLLTRHQQLVQHIYTMEEDMEAMDADRGIERTDRIQEEALETALTALDEQSRREVGEIQAALNRIEAGTYGTCEVCGEAISPERLEALPMARRCIDCQARLERVPRR